MAFVREPFKRAISLAAAVEPPAEDYYYQDYLYELMHDSPGAEPITEKQWETLVDMRGIRNHLVYASTTKHRLQNLEAKKKE